MEGVGGLDVFTEESDFGLMQMLISSINITVKLATLHVEEGTKSLNSNLRKKTNDQ